MRVVAWALVLLGLAGLADPEPGQAADPAVVATVTPEDCSLMERYQPSADVAYQPGVDVDGNAVAPADLGGAAPIQVPTTFSFKLKINPMQSLAGQAQGTKTATSSFGNTTMSVGTISVDTTTGQVRYNGQLLGAADREALAQACQGAAQ